MPSPVAHAAVGLVCAWPGRSLLRAAGLRDLAAWRWLPLGFVVLSLLPDFDSAAGLLLGDFGAYHNGISHSLLFGAAVALIVGGSVALFDRSRFLVSFFTVLACYAAHIVLDFLTWGRGVMLFWPVTAERFSSPVLIFYGLHWSDGLYSHRHLWTLLNETVFAAALVGVVYWVRVRRVRTGG